MGRVDHYFRESIVFFCHFFRHSNFCHKKDMKSGEYVSALLLVVGFGLQIAATVILRVLHFSRNSGEVESSSSLTEIHGIVILIVGMVILLLFGFVSTKESEISVFFDRVREERKTKLTDNREETAL